MKYDIADDRIEKGQNLETLVYREDLILAVNNPILEFSLPRPFFRWYRYTNSTWVPVYLNNKKSPFL
jgi:hypothetical protein